ncbi:MAG TPA: hypothetical protein VED87_01400, partial [Methylocystis sp.]|nr:hypothetical protein [Methylocystis sp.]
MKAVALRRQEEGGICNGRPGRDEERCLGGANEGFQIVLDRDAGTGVEIDRDRRCVSRQIVRQ